MSFIPILNIFAFGYLLEYSRRLRTNRDWELPEWKELNAGLLFSNGLQLLLIILGYFGIPTLLGWAISILIKNLSFGFIGILSYLPFTICVFFGPFLVLAAIHAFLRDGLFADAWKVSLILRIAHSFTPKLIIPVICFWGVIHPSITFVRNCIFSWHVDFTCLFECIKFFKSKLILNEPVCLLTITNVMHVDMIGSCINL